MMIKLSTMLRYIFLLLVITVSIHSTGQNLRDRDDDDIDTTYGINEISDNDFNMGDDDDTSDNDDEPTDNEIFDTPDNDDETTKSDATVWVPNVRQKYTKTINDLLVDQIKRELEASFIYQAYASYFERADVNLPGIQKFFAKASGEEKQHGQALIDYVNKRGGQVKFDDLSMMNACKAVLAGGTEYYVNAHKSELHMCICDFLAPNSVTTKCPSNKSRKSWKNGLMAFQDALAVERYVNEKLLQLHAKADEEKDAHLSHLLEHDFLDEQVHAIYELGNYITRLESFKRDYNLGEYLFDQKL